MGHLSVRRLHPKKEKYFSSAAEKERCEEIMRILLVIIKEVCPLLCGWLMVALNKGEQGYTLMFDRPRWNTRVPGGFIAKKVKYLHSYAAEKERP